MLYTLEEFVQFGILGELLPLFFIDVKHLLHAIKEDAKCQ